MMEVPQLHGFGPAANRLLEAYNTLLKVIVEALVLFVGHFVAHFFFFTFADLVIYTPWYCLIQGIKNCVTNRNKRECISAGK